MFGMMKASTKLLKTWERDSGATISQASRQFCWRSGTGKWLLGYQKHQLHWLHLWIGVCSSANEIRSAAAAASSVLSTTETLFPSTAFQYPKSSQWISSCIFLSIASVKWVNSFGLVFYLRMRVMKSSLVLYLDDLLFRVEGFRYEFWFQI